MSLYATVTRQRSDCILLVHGPCGVIHTAQIVPNTRSSWTRAEFDWAVERTGITRAQLYDAVRDFLATEARTSRGAA